MFARPPWRWPPEHTLQAPIGLLNRLVLDAIEASDPEREEGEEVG